MAMSRTLSKLQLTFTIPANRSQTSDFNDLLDAGAELFFKSYLKNLQQLYLGYNKITNFGFSKLAESPTTSIRMLSLNGNKIGSKGIKYIVKTSIPLMEKLWIYDCSIGNQGMVFLSKANWIFLRQLNVEKNNINLQGFSKLIHNWNQIKSLSYSKQFEQCPISFMNFVQTNWHSLEMVGQVFLETKYFKYFEADLTVVFQGKFKVS